jgi:gluconate 5-dehydrogenase
MTPSRGLEGRVAFITGSTRGIGWATARTLAEAGACVAINGRSIEAAEARRAELVDAGLDALAVPFDVTDEAAMTAAIERIVAERGRLDILVTNAGFWRRKPFEDHSLDDWYKTIDTKLTSAFTAARLATPHLVKHGVGRIVVISAISLFATAGKSPVDVAAEGGLGGLARALAVSLGPRGVTCNTIAPGFIHTEMTAGLTDDPDFEPWLMKNVPVGRWGRPEDVAGAVAYLVSDAASYVNGQVIAIDGGLTVAI